MQTYSTTKQDRSLSAIIFFLLIGIGLVIFSIITITCGFIVNYHEDFEEVGGNRELEAFVMSQTDFTQYWLGIPLLITAMLTIASAAWQHNRLLNTATLVAFHACIVLALFAMVLEGPDWIHWKNKDRLRRIWEDKDGYECSTAAMCKCSHTLNTTLYLGQTISKLSSCSNITTLSGLFGAIVASAIMAIILSLSGIIVVLKTISWREDHMFVRYDVSSAQQGISYDDVSYNNGKVYANGSAGRY